MAAVDPTYPLYPIACILSAAMLLLVLLTSFIRQSWNFGVALLCFWLFLENLTSGINAIIWADNADVKFYVYCDIVTHLQEIAAVVKPMATLIITRRLYLITSHKSVQLPSKAARRRDLAIEWTLGLVIPLVVAGPFYYIVQQLRFEVDEGFGCNNSPDGSILSILLLTPWSIIPPLVSIGVYYPRVARMFYLQSRDVNKFLQSNGSVSRTSYRRVFALASIDVLLTLPIGIVNLALSVKNTMSVGSHAFYAGWTYAHTEWEPEGFSYADMAAQGTSTVVQLYFSLWTSPVLAFAIFALFGVTPDARASYWRIICTIGGWFGWKPRPRKRRARSTLGDIQFVEAPLDSEIGSRPSFIDSAALAHERDVAGDGGESETCKLESESSKDMMEEVHEIQSYTLVSFKVG